jgi:2-phosphosulfolactate phosphatase
VDPAGFELRCEWGERGVAELAPISDAIVIVDVLSFSTCVDVAVARGARVWPWAGGVEGARELAVSQSAELAGARGSPARYSLSPRSLASAEPGERVVLPSPNGSSLSLATGATPTLCGCLRNASAVARAAARLGSRIAVVPAGERWTDGSLRPALEDWLGAGAVLAGLVGCASPEARAAIDLFRASSPELHERIADSVSGRELRERGFDEDVALASELDVSGTAPRLAGGSYGPD